MRECVHRLHECLRVKHCLLQRRAHSYCILLGHLTDVRVPASTLAVNPIPAFVSYIFSLSVVVVRASIDI